MAGNGQGGRQQRGSREGWIWIRSGSDLVGSGFDLGWNWVGSGLDLGSIWRIAAPVDGVILISDQRGTAVTVQVCEVLLD